MKAAPTMRRIGVVALILLLPAGLMAPVHAQKSASAGSDASIIAIKFHADWCGHCKEMGNVFEEMQAKFDQQPVLWITLDQTREHDRRQSAYLAEALDLDEIWTEYDGKTGFILLIDADTHQVIDKLTSDLTLKEMGGKLTAAIERGDA